MAMRCGILVLGRLLVASSAMMGCDVAMRANPSTSEVPLYENANLGTLIPELTKHPRRQVQHRSGGPKRLQTVAEATGSGSDPFRSPEECIDRLRNGDRLIRAPGTARVAAWNVRWFPDGVPGNSPGSSHATDVDWMACVLAWMTVDVVAFAEIKSKPRSELALVRLTDKLNELTHGRYAVHVDDCPEQSGQHVALLVDEKRVATSEWQIHAALNPNGDACAGQLRPGLGVKLRFPGGLDLHAIAIHLKSGVEPRDIELRRKSIDALERIAGSVTERGKDADLLVAGDFNTMGCRECTDYRRSAAEASWLDTRLKAFRPEMRRIPCDIGCSHYYQRQPSLLDHFLITKATEEADPATQASVFGHCRDLRCEAFSGREPESALHLSDHCPILLVLRDQDLD